MPRKRRSSAHSISSSSSSSTTSSGGPIAPLETYYPKNPNLTLSDFHTPRQILPHRVHISDWPVFTKPETQPAPKTHGPIAYWQFLASSLLSARNTFAARNQPIDNPRCSNVDRSAVLAVYNEAITRLEHVSELDARKIDSEVTRKISTILDLRSAQPEDEVFFSKTAFLSPLEPQYAQPRVDYYDRGGVDGDDGYGRVAGMRLREWRKEGWPGKYPRRAVERERRQRAARKRKGRKSGREGAEDALVKLLNKDEEWGDVVDADPERPWR